MGTPLPSSVIDVASTDVETATGTSSHMVNQSEDVADVDYSVFTISQRRYIIFMASWAGFFSPVSSQIYFPALNTLAQDLHVSNSLINLTLTSYMVSWSRALLRSMFWS
jgi:hypothetical protein